MKFKLSKTIEEEVEADLPYYYEHDLDDSTIYGMITQTAVITVHEKSSWRMPVGYEFEVDNNVKAYGCYLKSEYKSSKEEYNAAYDRMIKALNDWRS